MLQILEGNASYSNNKMDKNLLKDLLKSKLNKSAFFKGKANYILQLSVKFNYIKNIILNV